MDPFEARLQFIQIIETLNPSSVTLSKAIGFAMKNKDLHEDIHSVVVEMLGKVDINQRMNVMYFLEALVSAVASQNSSREFKDRPYVNEIQRDFVEILKKVVPESSLINLSGAVESLIEIEKFYPGVDNRDLRRAYQQTKVDSTPKVVASDEGFAKAWIYLSERKRKSMVLRMKLTVDKPTEEEDPSTSDNGLEKLSHKQIMQRMEDDRERHKRSKETNWVVSRPTGKISEAEFKKIWDQYAPLADEDLNDMRELYKNAGDSYQVNS